MSYSIKEPVINSHLRVTRTALYNNNYNLLTVTPL